MVQQRKNVSQATAASTKNARDVVSQRVPETGRVAERIDIYIRMNMDTEKDYCFNVPTNEPVSFLYSIFEHLPIQLHPGYFFYPNPQGFSVSVHPGYLTAEGALLFMTDSMKPKWTRHISDDALIGDAIAEGQLVVPEWKPHYRHEMMVVLFLLGWLYLDLPEYISPTPGTAPYLWVYKFADLIMPTPKMKNTEESLFKGKYWQLAFFTLHIIKVAFIYFILWNGAWNPNSMNPFKRLIERRKGVQLPNREQLAKMGWTGARRLAQDDWPERYHGYRSERAGGLVEAFRAGILTKPIGITLREGEGWNVLASPGNAKRVNSIKVDPNFLDAEGKFVVSPAYFKALAQPLANLIQEQDSEEKERQLVKDFRTFGYLDGPENLTDMFDLLAETHK